MVTRRPTGQEAPDRSSVRHTDTPVCLNLSPGATVLSVRVTAVTGDDGAGPDRRRGFPDPCRSVAARPRKGRSWRATAPRAAPNPSPGTHRLPHPPAANLRGRITLAAVAAGAAVAGGQTLVSAFHAEPSVVTA